MLTVCNGYFCAKSLQVSYLEFLHLNKNGKNFMTSLFYSPFIQIFKIIFYTGRYMAYTKLNIHIYSPTSYAHDFFFLLLIPERL